MNWWLVSNHLKHGMMTVRASGQPAITQAHEGMQEHHAENRDTENSRPMGGATMHGDVEKVSRSKLVWMITLSILLFALGLVVATTFGGL